MSDQGAQNPASKAPQVADPTPSDSQSQEQIPAPTDPASPPTQASSSREPAPQTPACTACQKTLETPKPCPRCHTTPYCSRECQKTDYKKHKKVCAELAQKYATTADIKMATTRVPPKNERRGGLQKWQFDT